MRCGQAVACSRSLPGFCARSRCAGSARARMLLATRHFLVSVPFPPPLSLSLSLSLSFSLSLSLFLSPSLFPSLSPPGSQWRQLLEVCRLPLCGPPSPPPLSLSLSLSLSRTHTVFLPAKRPSKEQQSSVTQQGYFNLSSIKVLRLPVMSPRQPCKNKAVNIASSFLHFSPYFTVVQ